MTPLDNGRLVDRVIAVEGRVKKQDERIIDLEDRVRKLEEDKLDLVNELSLLRVSHNVEKYFVTALDTRINIMYIAVAVMVITDLIVISGVFK
jgi:hypothetical protein